jgi:two-component sensor histidine kinase
VEWVVETARQVLKRVDDSLPEVRPGLHDDATDKLAAAVSSIPGDPKVYVVDAEGETVLTTDQEYRAVDIRDREYFVAAQRGEPFWVSTLLVSRINGSQIFTISHRMERDGRFAGVVILSLTSEFLERVWRNLRLDPKSTVGLFREDGWLVSRYPRPDGPMDLSGYVLFTEHLPSSSEGVYEAISPADAEHRYVGYQRVDGTALIALASIAIEPAMTSFWSQARWRLGLGGPVLLLLIGILFWIASLLRNEERQRAQLAGALERNTMLLRDVHHRVKNNLASVIGLVNASPIDTDAKRNLADRISAMADVYVSTYEFGDHFEMVDAATYIPRIIGNVSAGFGSPARIEYDLASVSVSGDKAMPLALIVNEVVTNALKYAFAERQGGLIQVSLREHAGEAILTITDNGSGFDPETAKKGMGSRLLRAFATQLSGEIDVRSDKGTAVEVRFPTP